MSGLENSVAAPVQGTGWGVVSSVREREENVRPAPWKEPFPDLAQLHLRHTGLTPDLCRSYAEAAGVCLSRHHEPPVHFTLRNDSFISRREVTWQSPDERVRRSWGNRDDATRDGAYSLSLAAIEAELGLVAIARADTGTGADYYVAPPGLTSDLETAFRLEVSGTDLGDESFIRCRLKKKIQQVRNGDGEGSAFVSIVGFAARQIMMAGIEESR